MVVLYDYKRNSAAPFSDVIIYEKRTGYIKFRTGDQIIEHSGRYSVENPVQ